MFNSHYRTLYQTLINYHFKIMRILSTFIGIFLSFTTLASTNEYKLDNGLRLIVNEDHRKNFDLFF